MIRIGLIDLCCDKSLVFDCIQSRRYCSLIANDYFDGLIVHWLTMILVSSQTNKAIRHRNQPIQCLRKTTEIKAKKWWLKFRVCERDDIKLEVKNSKWARNKCFKSICCVFSIQILQVDVQPKHSIEIESWSRKNSWNAENGGSACIEHILRN